MKFSIILYLIHLYLAYEVQTVSVFERTFKKLHKQITAPLVVSRGPIINEVFEQKLDNFDSNSNETWQMRYFANDEFHQPGGPIFIFVGGEGEIHEGHIRGGLFYDIAEELKGYLFTVEHRFYGDSWPTKNISLTNLKYLSSAQSLADLANFIKTQKQRPQFKNSKVILYSGSYPGSLVVWFRRLYPDLAVGGFASSAPIFANVDFKEYKEGCGYSMHLIGGESCYNRLSYAIQELEAMFDQKRFDEAKKVLKICDGFDAENKLDVWSLFSSISNVAAGLVQAHDKGDIEKACKTILSGTNDVDGLVKWLDDELGPETCYNYEYAGTLGALEYTDHSLNFYRQWTYQLCTEFGFFQTSSSMNQPFGTKFPPELFTQTCNDAFGIPKEQVEENIKKTNQMYGGWHPNVTNIYFTQGDLDPWNRAGLPADNDGENSVIPFYAHCKDFDSISEDDTKEMKASKAKLTELVKKWLS